jgi:two-component system response regulator MprA
MKKILIIDDDQSIQTVLSQAFRDEKFDVEVRGDGKEGLETALATHPDLIVLDIELPSMRGGMILGKLREDAWGKNVPVLVLSSNATAGSIADIMSKGSYEYLLKSDWKLEDVVTKAKHILEM